MRKRNAVGTRMRELRHVAGMHLDDVADAAGISAGHLSRIERGETGPSFMIATRIAAVLGVGSNELATMQREQSATDTELMAILTARGLTPAIAQEITGKISTSARLALLEVITDNEAP